jgi:hypothetical protein
VSKIVYRFILAASFLAYLAVCFTAPWALSDCNSFLKGFVDEDLLSVLGVIVAITLASAANIHLEFNKIEDRAQQEILMNTRRALKRAAHSLLILFCCAVMVVVAKPLLPSTQIAQALVNGLALLIVLFNVLVLIDLTRLVFRIEPMFKLLPRRNRRR